MRTTVIVAAVAALALAPIAAQAQQHAAAGTADRTRFGVQVSYADDADLGVGVFLDYPLNRLLNNQPVFAQVSGDVFFPGNDVTYAELNWNAAYKFRIQNSPLAPYAGAGLVFAYTKVGGGCAGDCSDTNLGLNLLGGIQFPSAGRLLPFVQLRYEARDNGQFVLTGGIHF